MASTSNLRAVNRAIKALALEDSHAALVELARSLARAVDADPCGDCKAAQDAALWREYRQAVMALAEAGDGGDDDRAAAFLVSISTPRAASLGDSRDA